MSCSLHGFKQTLHNSKPYRWSVTKATLLYRSGVMWLQKHKTKLFRWLHFKWTSYEEEDRKWFLAKLGILLNFGANSAALALPLWIIFPVSYWKTLLCLWILLPFIEHYYVWIREGWRDNLQNLK